MLCFSVFGRFFILCFTYSVYWAVFFFLVDLSVFAFCLALEKLFVLMFLLFCCVLFLSFSCFFSFCSGAAGEPQESRNAELQEKFDVAVPSIKEKLKQEADRRQIQRETNDDLRGKLTNFAEQARRRYDSTLLFGTSGPLLGLLYCFQCSRADQAALS